MSRNEIRDPRRAPGRPMVTYTFGGRPTWWEGAIYIGLLFGVAAAVQHVFTLLDAPLALFVLLWVTTPIVAGLFIRMWADEVQQAKELLD